MKPTKYQRWWMGKLEAGHPGYIRNGCCYYRIFSGPYDLYERINSSSVTNAVKKGFAIIDLGEEEISLTPAGRRALEEDR